jgi:hypothetical protein
MKEVRGMDGSLPVRVNDARKEQETVSLGPKRRCLRTAGRFVVRGLRSLTPPLLEYKDIPIPSYINTPEPLWTLRKILYR